MYHNVQLDDHMNSMHRYGLKEIRRHGEAASVDQDAVMAERRRVQEILAKYEQKNIFNFDETGLFT